MMIAFVLWSPPSDDIVGDVMRSVQSLTTSPRLFAVVYVSPRHGWTTLNMGWSGSQGCYRSQCCDPLLTLYKNYVEMIYQDDLKLWEPLEADSQTTGAHGCKTWFSYQAIVVRETFTEITLLWNGSHGKNHFLHENVYVRSHSNVITRRERLEIQNLDVWVLYL